MTTQKPSPYASHDEVVLLLPWYVNDNLTEVEKNLVKEHLRICLTCRKELAEHQLLAKKMQHTSAVEVSATQSFQRLMARIQADEQAQTANQNRQKPAVSKTGWLQRIAGFLPEKRMVAAFASLVMVVSALSLMQDKSPITAQQFHTVANKGSLDKFDKNDIRVVFAKSVTQSQIDVIVQAVQGHIVPELTNAIAYTIRIDSLESSEQKLAAAISELRTNKSVLFAEPALPWQPQPMTDKGG